MKNGVKMSDIAKRVGVSIVTVSNALAGRDGVSDELRQKISAVAEEIGYKPLNSRKSPKKKAFVNGKSVGILTSKRFAGSSGTFYWELTANISGRLSALDVYTVYECISAENEENGVQPDIVLYGKADAVIVVGQVHRNYIEMLNRINLPVVLVDFYDNRYNIDSVNSDSYHGGYMLTDYLIKNGHSRIGFFGTLNATSSINDRFMGYIKCLIENNIAYRDDWRIDDRDKNGMTFEKIVFPNDMPTAFVCNCDETAFRVISELKSKGVRVPEDISVVGYDNYTVSSICIPPITTIEVDIAKMAELSAEITVNKLIDPNYSGGKRIISGKLIEKQSVLNITPVR